MPSEVLSAAYKLARQVAEHDDCNEHVASDCDAICEAILRVLHHVDRQAYVELVGWDASRVRFEEVR